MHRLTLVNNEADVAITIGVAGGLANAGGRSGSYQLMPGEEVPVEIDEGTTIAFTFNKVKQPEPAA